MNAITVTREYGAGGYEVAQRLSERLGWELLDRELLHQAAAVEHLSDAELELLDEKAINLTDRFRLHPPHERYLHGLQTAAHQAVARGNVVLVGRGTGQLLANEPSVFHLRLSAAKEWRARRMAQREGWSFEQALVRCTEEDRTRERFTRYFFGDAPFQASRYHAVFNTERVTLEDVASCVAAFVLGEVSPDTGSDSVGPRVLTLSRELDACDPGFVPALAKRLGLRAYDRELLEQEAVRLGVSEVELDKIDEQPAGIFQRLRPGSLYHRYFETLGQLMHELAGRGNVLIVGRGSSRVLKDHLRAVHVRLVAPLEARVRRMMEHRWMREETAQQFLAQSDAQRRQFFENHFGADWASPLQYHVTVNSSWLGPAAVDLIAGAAERVWRQIDFV